MVRSLHRFFLLDEGMVAVDVAADVPPPKLRAAFRRGHHDPSR
jgi:hypothetical protein